MANLKEIRSRITSVSSTMKITSAMKMVSASKLKKAQDRLENIKPYANALKNTINNILPTINQSDIKLLGSSCIKEKLLIVALSSNRGLCGGFNSNIFKKTKELKNSSMDIFCIGKKAAEQFTRHKYNIVETNIGMLDKPNLATIEAFSKKLIHKFIQGEYSKIIIVYNKFKNTATQNTEIEQLLPINLSFNEEREYLNKDYIFEPDKTEIVNTLIPKQIETQVFKSILNSITSEHGARMTAMHKATDNAEELRQSLTLSYNRQRQAAITNEILEIVAGAEALKNT